MATEENPHPTLNAAEARYEAHCKQFKAEAAEARENSGLGIVEDFVLHQTTGPIRLSECFEGKRDLFVIHNMGTGCSYCTMWADGVNGVQHHLRDRAGLILVSPNPPDVVEAFAKGRDWKMPVASVKDSGLSPALNLGDDAAPGPAMSTFHLTDSGEIEHIVTENFGPFDLYSPVWHFVDRLKDGVNGWEPKFSYDETNE